jgi:AbiEi antitoxin C-terminal domain
MGDPFIGSESVTSGRLSPYALRSRYAAMHPDVYLAIDSEVTAITRAQAAWLWSRRQGVVAGQSAAALHGAKWVDARRPAEMLWHNRRPPTGIHVWSDAFDTDEVEVIGGMGVTTPARTALDLACRYPLGEAVAAIDALARATHLKIADVELMAARYRGRRGIRKARMVLDLADPGAESPKETWLRLLVIRNGFPRPQTQIPVYDEYGALVAVLDMGWEDIKLALDYEGDHHRNPVRFNKDIRRHDDITELGWMDIRVTSRDTEGGIVGRLTTEWSRRT